MISFQDSLHSQNDRPKFTGKQLVMLKAGISSKAIVEEAKKASLKLVCFDDFKENIHHFHRAFEDGDGIVFEQCGVAVINQQKEEQVTQLTTAAGNQNPFLYAEPERYVYTLSDSFKEFMMGYKAADDNIYQNMEENTRLSDAGETSFQDDEQASWGIHATHVLQTKWSGKGVKVAILDTGFDLSHPDFKERDIKSKSFVKDEEVDDQNGHGTHCTGISTGNKNKETGRRYGVAEEPDI